MEKRIKKCVARQVGEVWKDTFNPSTPWRMKFPTHIAQYRTKKLAMGDSEIALRMLEIENEKED